MAGRMVRQLQEGGDIGDTIAIILGVLIILTAVCAFLGILGESIGSPQTRHICARAETTRQACAIAPEKLPS